MARKPTQTLTEAELRIMKVLWQKKSATVRDVVEELTGSQAYNSVLTILGILERKGYVRHTQRGRAFLYHAVVDQREARRNVVRFVLNRFFDDSPELLVLNLLEHEDIDEEELARFKNKLRQED